MRRVVPILAILPVAAASFFACGPSGSADGGALPPKTTATVTATTSAATVATLGPIPSVLPPFPPPAPEPPCETARKHRARVTELLAAGKLDRTVRVII